MINLNDHTVEIGDMVYVPLAVAQAAVAEAYSSNKLDEAIGLIKNAMEEMNESVNDALRDD